MAGDKLDRSGRAKGDNRIPALEIFQLTPDLQHAFHHIFDK